MATERPGAAGPTSPGIAVDGAPPTAGRPVSGDTPTGGRPVAAGRPASGGRLASGLLAVLVCGLTASAALVPLAGLGHLRPWLGVPLVAVATAVLLALWRPDRAVAPDRACPRWFLPAALVVAALAVGPSLAFTNAHALRDRDPGVYVSTAVTARSQGTLLPDTPPPGPFTADEDVLESSAGDRLVNGARRGFLGLHLLPVQAAALGWVGGDALMVRTGALLAGAGLLLLMAVARRVVGAPLALVVGVALGASLPFAHLSRDLYSEWPLFALVAGGLWALDAALAERSVPRAVVAGAAFGAATMARLDGLVTVSGLVLVVGLWAAVARGRPGGSRRARVALAVAVPAGVGWLAGMADGWYLSRSYLDAHRSEVLVQTALPLGGLALVVVVALAGPDRLRTLADRLLGGPSRTGRDPRRQDARIPDHFADGGETAVPVGGDQGDATRTGRDPRRQDARIPDQFADGGEPVRAGIVGATDVRTGSWERTWVAPRAWAIAAAVAAVGLAFLLVVVRPAFPSGGELPDSSITAGLQAAEGQDIDPGRTYAELSGRWLVWYLGAATVAAATMGGALLLAGWLRGRRVRIEALVAGVVAPPLVLYLARPSIYPDQPWASRRLLPAVLPGALLAAAWLARWLWERRGRLGRTGPAAGTAAVVVAVAMVAHPLVVLAPLVRMRQHTDEVAMVRDLCAEVPADAALLTVALPAQGWVPALTAFCDRPVGGVVDPDGADPAQVEALARAWAVEGRPLWLVGPAGSVLTPLGARPTVSVSSDDDIVLRSSLTRRPSQTRSGRTVLVAGPVALPPG